jgi:hypothetical protein
MEEVETLHAEDERIVGDDIKKGFSEQIANVLVCR